MNNIESCLATLISTWKESRDYEFSQRALSIVQEMNGRGMLDSSETINRVYVLSEKELSARAKEIFDTIIRAYESTENKLTENLNNRLTDAFDLHLTESKTTLEKIRSKLVGGIANSCLSKSMLRTDVLNSVYDSLRKRYAVEIDMYAVKAKRNTDKNLTSKLVHSFLDRPAIAIPTVAILGIVAIAKLFDSVESISGWFQNLMQ